MEEGGAGRDVGEVDMERVKNKFRIGTERGQASGLERGLMVP